MYYRPLLFVALLIVMLAAPGCLFSPDDDGGDDTPPPSTHVFPDTADKLVANFVRYYEERNLERYREVLSSNYRFIAKDETEYNFDRDIDIHDKMFNEVAGDGGIAFEDITVQQMNPLGTWEAVPENDPFFGGASGSLYRAYDVFINFKVSGQNLVFEVTGLVIFYVTSREVEVDGTTRTMYELLGQKDETNG